MHNPETEANHVARKSPRSKSQIAIEILKILKKGERKRTELAHECKINYILATKLTDDMERKKWIDRNTEGWYKITDIGMGYLVHAIEMEKIGIMEVYG